MPYQIGEMTRMFLYRYRAPTELSFKELLYNELYFASPPELNDPFDGQYYYEFPADVDCWERLLRMAIDSRGFLSTVDFKPAAIEISNQCPISYTEVLNTEILEKVFTKVLTDSLIFKLTATFLSQLVKDFLKQYEPSKGYVVSFSKHQNDPLMWSHYSAQHSGFCLIFRTAAGAIKQQAGTVRTKISPADGVFSSVQTSFRIEEVIYEEQPLHLNAFWLLPTSVNHSASLNDDEKIRLNVSHRQFLLTKDVSWDYEAEWRALLPQPSKFLGGKNEIPSIQRLFYYEPSQLVGIIFGARCTDSTKAKIESIILHKRQRQAISNSDEKTLTNFAFFQSNLNGNSRKTLVSPVKIIDMTDRIINPTMPNFNDLLAQWNEGECIFISGNNSQRGRQD